MSNDRKALLPYSDTKSVGASDFYFAINATFRFIQSRAGIEGLRNYWTDLGTKYYAPVSVRWKTNGLTGIAEYWRAFFRAEPGADVIVEESETTVTLRVKTCPMIKHLRDNGREIVPCFCQHCYFVNQAIAVPAGFSVQVEGGNGACLQTFQRFDKTSPIQDLTKIEVAS